MTDDKGAGEGAYVVTEVDDDEIGRPWFMISGPGIDAPKKTASLIRGEVMVTARIWNRIYDLGRKAERERCALIAETEIVEHNDGDESYSCGAGKLIAEKIRGGQDGE